MNPIPCRLGSRRQSLVCRNFPLGVGFQQQRYHPYPYSTNSPRCQHHYNHDCNTVLEINHIIQDSQPSVQEYVDEVDPEEEEEVPEEEDPEEEDPEEEDPEEEVDPEEEDPEEEDPEEEDPEEEVDPEEEDPEEEDPEEEDPEEEDPEEEDHEELEAMEEDPEEEHPQEDSEEAMEEDPEEEDTEEETMEEDPEEEDPQEDSEEEDPDLQEYLAGLEEEHFDEYVVLALQQQLEEEERQGDNNGHIETTVVLEHLSSKVYRKLSENQEPEICVVCQSEFEEEEILIHLDCRHEYHVECITKWLSLKNLCPLCKRPVLPITSSL